VRLVHSNDREEFGGTCNAQTLLGGLGNVDDNVINLPGAPWRTVTLRSAMRPPTSTTWETNWAMTFTRAG